VFADLQAEPSSVHPILQVDAIKYLFTFRNQVRIVVRCHRPDLILSLLAYEGAIGLGTAVVGSTSGIYQLRRLLVCCYHHRKGPLHQAEWNGSVSRIHDLDLDPY
jgi:hypothetical protein